MSILGKYHYMERALSIAVLGGFTIDIRFEDDVLDVRGEYEKIRKEIEHNFPVDVFGNILNPEGEIILLISNDSFDSKRDEVNFLVLKHKLINIMKTKKPELIKSDTVIQFLSKMEEIMSLSLRDMLIIDKLVVVIAWLDGLKTFNPSYFSEACYLRKDAGKRPVFGYEYFGGFGGIRIPKGFSDMKQIRDAITYLRNLEKESAR